MKRRNFLKLSTVTSLWLLTGCGGGGTNSSGIDGGLANSTNKLTIPPLLTGTDVNGVKNYDLTIQNIISFFIYLSFNSLKLNHYIED